MSEAFKVASLLVWFALLVIGSTVAASTLSRESAIYFPLYLCAATGTNVGLLCIAASVAATTGTIWASITRGFVIYLALISGAVVLFTESIVAPTAEQYFKLAGAASLVCVLIGQRPELFDAFVQRAMWWENNRIGQNENTQ